MDALRCLSSVGRAVQRCVPALVPFQPRQQFPGLALGFKDVTMHSCRHTYATLLLKRGVPLSVVSALLGHRSIRMTADHYGHVQPDQKRLAADALVGLFGS